MTTSLGVTDSHPAVSLGERQGEPQLLKRSSIDEAEGDLITSLYPSLRKIAAVAGSFDVEPDDLVQEALVRVLRKGSISDLDNPLAFLRKTIVNLASNQRRSLGRKRSALGRLSIEEGWWPSIRLTSRRSSIFLQGTGPSSISLRWRMCPTPRRPNSWGSRRGQHGRWPTGPEGERGRHWGWLVSDFETKLRWLSERGNPVGVEELIERIKADMADDPLVVVDKRREGTMMTKTKQPPTTEQKRSRFAGLGWALAAFVAVLAVGGLSFALTRYEGPVADTPPPPTVVPDVQTMTDLEVIEAGVAALYSGDADRAVELFDLNPKYRDDDQIRQEAAYQGAIGGRLTLDCTEWLKQPGTFTCNVQYHNSVTDAVGYVDSPGDSNRVVVQGGVISQFPLPEHTFLLSEVGNFLREQVEGDEGCVNEPPAVPSDLEALRTPECARLIMDHLDEWADWCGQIVQPSRIFAQSCDRE